MDQELIAYLDKRFEQIEKELSGVRGAVRGNGVEIEGLRGQIQQVAEGVATCNERIDSFRTEASGQFKELRETFQASHSQLHRRVSALETWRETVDPSPPVARKRQS